MAGEPRGRVYHPSGGVSKTRQSEAAAADINNIVKKWLRTGVLIGTDKEPKYGDFSNVDDYLACQLRVKQAEADFMELPAAVRKACENNPGKFLDMIATEDGAEKLKALGLVERHKPVQAREAVLEPAPVPSPGAEEPTQ